MKLPKVLEASNHKPRRQDLNDARDRTQKASTEVIKNNEQDIRIQETSKEVQRVRKIRPERRLNIHDAIKISLGFKTNRRVSEEKSAQEDDKNISEKVCIKNSTDNSLKCEKLEENYQKPKTNSLETFTDFLRHETNNSLKLNRCQISPDAPEFIPKHLKSSFVQNVQIPEPFVLLPKYKLGHNNHECGHLYQLKLQNN